MPKKDRAPHFTDEELHEMTYQQKLDRLIYLQKEIKSTKDNQRDRNAANREYIGELEAQIEEITKSVEQAPPPEDSVQAETGSP